METLKEMRRQKGWSQKDLADSSGVGQDTISGIESGRHEPRPSTLRKLAKALDVQVADFFREPALPKAEAPRGAGRVSSEALNEWLKNHGARRALMSDEEIVGNCERVAAGTDRQAIPARFEQEMLQTLREETNVLDALMREWTRGGKLLPKGDMSANARMSEYHRLGREIRFLYRRHLKALDDFQVALYLEGRVDDFVMVASRPQIAEARKAAMRALRDEAFENSRGA